MRLRKSGKQRSLGTFATADQGCSLGGCTIVSSANYDSFATFNDGTCADGGRRLSTGASGCVVTSTLATSPKTELPMPEGDIGDLSRQDVAKVV